MSFNINSAIISLEKTHGISSTQDMLKIVRSMRFSSLQGIKLKSDRQPKSIFVENIRSTPDQWAPSIIAATRPNGGAWMRVTVDANHWSRLSYQFGHELGHIICNSWGYGSIPLTPCQWVEEVCVEAFSIRGLFKLSERWRTNPPYDGLSSYAPDLCKYAESRITDYKRLSRVAGISKDDKISSHYRNRLSNLLKLGPHAKALVPEMVEMFLSEKILIEDLGALNRWPGRSSLPIETYICAWTESCKSIGSPGVLPRKLKAALSRAAW